MMQSYSHIFKVSLFLLVMAVSSCHKAEEFPVEPEITFTSFEPKSDGTAQLTFEFTDGDGDIGLNPRDTLNPYNPGNKYYYNVFVEYYELQNGIWTLIPITNPPLYYRSPVVTPKGQNKTLNGSMTIDLPFYHNPASSFDTIKLSMQLVDRALNESNIVETSTIVKP